MKSFFVTLLFLLSFQITFSQNDKLEKKKSITIHAKVTPVKKSKDLNLNNKDGFKDAYKKQQKVQQRIKKEQDLINKGIITPEMLTKQRFKKNVEKNNLRIPMVDKDLGSFHTQSDVINILCYDFGLVDGDIISIYKNGKLIIDRHVLNKEMKVFKIPLTIGFNRIDIVAKDEGQLRPNTGHFSVFDNKDNTVISDFWNLAKGAKVTALIIRDKKQ